jgi:hypothetical protein
MTGHTISDADIETYVHVCRHVEGKDITVSAVLTTTDGAKVTSSVEKQGVTRSFELDREKAVSDVKEEVTRLWCEVLDNGD